jgi:hypothetical protein
MPREYPDRSMVDQQRPEGIINESRLYFQIHNTGLNKWMGVDLRRRLSTIWKHLNVNSSPSWQFCKKGQRRHRMVRGIRVRTDILDWEWKQGRWLHIEGWGVGENKQNLKIPQFVSALSMAYLSRVFCVTPWIFRRKRLKIVFST